jgi:amino acid transporter
MGGLGALLITLSGLSPSIGVFVVASSVIHATGVAALAAFLAAGLLGIPIAAVYAELASAVPETGGEYTIAGRILGPSAGFAMLGLNLLTFSIAPALTALGVADYLGAPAGLPSVALALAVVTGCALIAALNIRVNAWVTGVFLAVEAASLAVITGLGLWHARRGAAALISDAHSSSVGAPSVAALCLGAAGAIYAFDGYGAVVYLGEEMRQAPRRVAKVVFLALALAAAFQLIPLTAVFVGAPDLAALKANAAPVLFFLSAMGGSSLRSAVSLAVAVALINAMIALMLMGARQLYSSARDGGWPAPISRSLSALHPGLNSPVAATLVLGASSALWCLVKAERLVILLGDGTALIYLCMCVAALKNRSRKNRPSPYRMPLFPAPPLLGITALVGVVLIDLGDPEGRAGLFVSFAVAGASALYYRLSVRAAGAWAHRGPTAEDGLSD